MSEYFTNFPRIQYDINGTNLIDPDYTVVVNLMVKQKVRDAVDRDIIVYYPYHIPPETRPEIVSYQVYGDVAYTWTIFYANKMLDPYWEWPLDVNQFLSYIKSKYGSVEIAKTTVHHYEQIIRARAEATGTSDAIEEVTYEIDYSTYRTLDDDVKKIKYTCEYEDDLNESRRTIKLIDPQFISAITDEFRGLFR